MSRSNQIIKWGGRPPGTLTLAGRSRRGTCTLPVAGIFASCSGSMDMAFRTAAPLGCARKKVAENLLMWCVSWLKFSKTQASAVTRNQYARMPRSTAALTLCTFCLARQVTCRTARDSGLRMPLEVVFAIIKWVEDDLKISTINNADVIIYEPSPLGSFAMARDHFTPCHGEAAWRGKLVMARDHFTPCHGEAAHIQLHHVIFGLRCSPALTSSYLCIEGMICF